MHVPDFSRYQQGFGKFVLLPSILRKTQFFIVDIDRHIHIIFIHHTTYDDVLDDDEDRLLVAAAVGW